MRFELKIVVFLLAIAFNMNCKSKAQSLPEVSSGSIERIENFESDYVTSRNVDVWLPDGYTTDKKYAVLYMHDGQMLYDPNSTWNKQSWNADEVAGKLIADKETQPFIIVGIWNDQENRHIDYFPQKPFESLNKEQRDFVDNSLKKSGRTVELFKPISDNYLKFLTLELMPVIEEKYSIYTDTEHTFIAGSSMGGLISMYAISEYPEIFGGAACLSTHWPGIFDSENNPVPKAFRDYLESKLPVLIDKKIYFDHGDQTLDAMYPPLQKAVNQMMDKFCVTYKQKSMEAGEKISDTCDKNWVSKFYPGTNHSEEAWAARLDVPLVFLLKNES